MAARTPVDAPLAARARGAARAQKQPRASDVNAGGRRRARSTAGAPPAISAPSGAASAAPDPPKSAARALHCLVTGYPGFIAKRLVRELLSTRRSARLTVLVEEGRRADAEADLALLGVRGRARVTVGDVSKMDLGLSGTEIAALRDVTHVFHLAGIQRADAPPALLQAVNVDGVRNIIAFARELKGLQRFVHFSSCLVAGDREGVVMEDELEVGQRFDSFYDESKLRGEKLARAAMADLPVTIVRPAFVVGSSQTGEVDRFDGVYAMGILIVTSPISVPLPLPGTGKAPLHLVPVDYVVRAACALGFTASAVGQTFHLVDPNPLAARTVYELIARRAGKRMPANRITSSLAASLLRIPGIERLSQRRMPHLASFSRFVLYNSRNTLHALEGTGIRCPPFDSYVDKLMAFVAESLRNERREQRTLAPDPLDA